MLPSTNIFYLIVLIIVFLIRSIVSDCDIILPEDHSLRPIYYKYVGSHKLKINTNRNFVLQLHEKQRIEAHCYINFKRPEDYEMSNILHIRCSSDDIYISTMSYYENEERNYYTPTLECSSSKWDLHESISGFKWCPFNVTSYFLARSKHTVALTVNHDILAGICYDIYNFSFYSVYYTLDPKKSGYAQPPISEYLHYRFVEINDIEETFRPNKISENVYDDNQFKNWISHANYDFSLIIQHQKLYYTFHDQFSPLLEFVWWRNLRLYNWNRYINALERHVESDNKVYDILAGVSGAIKAPIIKDCSKNYIMEEVVFNTTRRIPLYVWNYLQDSANSSNEVVVIGLNSPFHEFYSLDDIIFCPEKCQDIPWLKEYSSSFRYGIMGIVFCCEVEDVRFSKRLHGFPDDDIKPKPVELTTTSSYELTESDDYE